MKKIINYNLILFLLLFLLILNFKTIYAYSNLDEVVKIGLESLGKNISKIDIKNLCISIGYDINFKNSLILNAKSNFSINIDRKSYTKTGEKFSDYKKTQEVIYKYIKSGFKAVPVLFDDNHWEIYLEGNKGNLVELKARFLLKDGENNIILFDNNTLPIKIKALNNDCICIENRNYRGDIEFVLNDNFITVINLINIEEYLYSVVASEMSSKWDIEALKAQAVASRSYIISTIDLKKHKFYDVCDKVHCQLYLGKDSETINSILAVETTKGLKIYHNGNVINSTYFSSSGGITENSENVWNEKILYLRSIEDIHEKECITWSRTFKFQDIEKGLINRGVNIGKIRYIILDKFFNGRVANLIIGGSKGTHVISKEDIRKFFNFGLQGDLPSRNFKILNDNINFYKDSEIYVVNNKELFKNNISNLYVIDKNRQVFTDMKKHCNIKNNNYEYDYNLINDDTSNKFTFEGKGFGHGVGMSQYGAKGMAEKSFTYDQILKFYFKDIEIK